MPDLIWILKLAENGKPSVDGAVAVVKKDGTVIYKGPQGVTDIQDQIVVEVFDKNVHSLAPTSPVRCPPS